MQGVYQPFGRTVEKLTGNSRWPDNYGTGRK